MINQSPFRAPSLETALRFVQPEDALLLIEDAVYGAQDGTAFSEKIKKIAESNDVYALQPDLKARGIAKILDGIKTVDYEGFVDLVEKHNVNTWL